MSTSLQSRIKNIALFQNLEQKCIDAILLNAYEVEVTTNETLFTEADEAKGFYVVLDGAIKHVRFTADGREFVLFIARKGQTVGEGALFQNSSHPISAVAMEKTDLLFIPRALCLELIKSSSEFASEIINIFALRQRMLTNKLAAQSERNALRRVAGYILHRYSIEGGEANISLNLTREEMANLLGFARETLSRQLSILVDCGAIILDGRSIFIKNEEILKSKADGNTI